MAWFISLHKNLHGSPNIKVVRSATVLFLTCTLIFWVYIVKGKHFILSVMWLTSAANHLRTWAIKYVFYIYSSWGFTNMSQWKFITQFSIQDLFEVRIFLEMNSASSILNYIRDVLYTGNAEAVVDKYFSEKVFLKISETFFYHSTPPLAS